MPTSVKSIEGYWKDFYIPDFLAVHQPLDNIPNEFRIFGNLPITPQAEDLPRGLDKFLGRWEGIEYGPYGETGTRVVLLISAISSQGGIAYLWAGTDLQYPFYVKEIHFQTISGEIPTIQWQGDLTGPLEGRGVLGALSIQYDRATDHLVGSVRIPPSQDVIRTIQFVHGDTYHYFRDY
jgi:hypothetical protein